MDDNTAAFMGLNAAQVAIAERKADTPFDALEDPDKPKMGLIVALGWVKAKQDEPQLSYEEYAERATVGEVLAALGLDPDDDDDQEGEEGAGPGGPVGLHRAG